jgi:hypothetical protein
MALSIQTGVGSLITLGLGASDLKALYEFGKVVGNWLTASGEEDDLFNLPSVEQSVLKRTDVFDMDLFLQRWNRRMTLLVNGRPSTLEGHEAEATLPALSRLTAIMVAITAALDEFMDWNVMAEILLQLLLKLFSDDEALQSAIQAQIRYRIRSWRSMANIRGLSMFMRSTRSRLIESGACTNGLMPSDDAPRLVEFLHWLLSEISESYTTSSSDVTGVATCLASAAFDGLGIKGFDKDTSGKSCQLYYTCEGFLHSAPSSCIVMQRIERRESHIAVSLKSIDKTMASLPLDPEMAASWRKAWISGARVAASMRCRVVAGADELDLQTLNLSETDSKGDVRYEFCDLEQPRPLPQGRHWISILAHGYFYLQSPRVLSELEGTLQNFGDENLSWLQEELEDRDSTTASISSSSMVDATKITVFTIFQAFFMGYQYGILRQVVDTTHLTSEIVEGSWGYRSKELMIYIRDRIRRMRSGRISRERLMEIAFALFSGERKQIPSSKLPSQCCLGLVGKRTLLVNSLVGDSDTLDSVGKMCVFDVDTSGVPTDVDGIIRAGAPAHFNFRKLSNELSANREYLPEREWTKHIVPASQDDPTTLLLCIRAGGRLIGTVNPALADALVCKYHNWSEDDEVTGQKPNGGLDFVLGRILEYLMRKQQLPSALSSVVLDQVGELPCMRYAILGFIAGREASSLLASCSSVTEDANHAMYS